MGGIMDTTSLFNNQVLVGLTSVSYDHMEILGNTINEIIYQKVNILKENSTLIISNRNQEYLSEIKKQLLVSNYELIVANKYEDAFVEYQKDNMGLAKEILKYLDIVDDSIFTLSPPNGRFTRFQMDGYEVIVDGAHNVDVLYASINTKDYLTNLKLLKENFNEVYITEFDNLKSWKLSNVDHDLKVLD
ncbi:hypothetical protein FQA39_LY12974 [Lamprigera yunnana]|nr:hypothetical protein FQA39_LY12974 [Lamprigera yunnana]